MSIESSDETHIDSCEADGLLSETAKNVTSHAGEQAKQVADEAKDQVREVAADAKNHAIDLLDQTRLHARRQAEDSTKHVASGLHSLGDQIQALREGRPEDAGQVAGYADRARRRLDDVAGRLDRGGLDGVASDLAAFARRRPGLFLLSCAGAGFALARIVRGGSGGDDGAADSSRPPGATLVGATVPEAEAEAEADPGLSVGVPVSGLP